MDYEEMAKEIEKAILILRGILDKIEEEKKAKYYGVKSS
jgi:hypothetical protein